MNPSLQTLSLFSRRPAPRRLAAALAAGSLLTLAVGPGLQPASAQTLPSGLNVVQGQARVNTVGNQMTVSNSNGAILNWNSFSIGANNAVRFEQANASSQVLNRVLGNDPSNILGQLSSNGRVWLLNPNGVLFGQNARINVAGLVTSTLNLSDKDWTAGRYSFSGSNGSKAEIVNQGELRTTLGGHVALVGASVKNEGLIEAPGGQILLAAGQSVELIDTGSPNLSVKVTAPQGQALNLGTLAAAGGRIDIHGAIVNQQGIVRADSLQGSGGDIVLRASQTLNLGAQSSTTANGATGGQITVDAGAGTVMIQGQIAAIGSEGQGGQIKLLGRQVGLVDAASVNASGASGGGQVLVGGGQEGKDASVPNSEAVFFGKDASISADATVKGEGGRIILWSDKATRAFGTLSAMGGALGGNGGFIETSGGWLDARPAQVRTGAPKGKAGTWLLDPYDLVIGNSGTEGGFSVSTGTETSFVSTGSPSFILASTLNNALGGSYDGAGHIRIQTISGGAGNQAGNVSFSGVTLNGTYTGGSSLTVDAAGSIDVLNSVFTNGGAGDNIKLSFIAGGNVSFTNVGMPKASGLSIRGADVLLRNTSVTSQFIPIDIAASGKLTLGLSTVLTSNLAGDAIRLQAAKFENNSTGQNLQTPTPGSRWLVLGVDPANGTDFAPGNLSHAFKQYGYSGGTVLGTGNGFLFSKAQTASLSGTVASRGYDGGVTAQISNPSLSGLVTGDQATLSLEPGLQAQFQSKDAAAAVPVVVTGKPYTFTDASNKPVYGYQLSTAGLTGTILKKELEPVVTVNNKVYDGGTTATANVSGLLGLVGSEVIGYSVSGNFIDKNVGTSKNVSLSYQLSNGSGPNGGLASNYTVGPPASIVTADITPATLVVSGIKADNKVYDGNANATFSGTPSFTALGNDDVKITGLGSGTFFTKHVGQGRGVQFFGFSVSGADASNYNVVAAGSFGADITPAPLVVTGLTAANKVYDGSTAATLSGSPAVSPLGGDVVFLQGSAAGQFADKNVGNAIPVTGINGLSLTGIDSFNYTLVAPAGLKADITPKPLNFTMQYQYGTVYDGTKRAYADPIEVTGLVGSETVLLPTTATYASKNVGERMMLIDVTLADGSNGGLARNYSIVNPHWEIMGIITPATLPLTGVTALNKVYDRTTAAPLTGQAGITPIGGDDVTLQGSLSGSFDSKNVGSAKPVSLSGLSLAGADAGNYVLALPVGLNADITPAPLALTGLSLASKAYDGTTAATFNGSPAVLPLSGDVVGLQGSATAQFTSKNVGNAIPITAVTGLSLTGQDAANYTLVAPAELAADITPRPLQYSLQVANKVYDGTTAATVTGQLVAAGLVSGESLGLSASGQFVSKNVGEVVFVSPSVQLLDGAGGGRASNYVLDNGNVATDWAASITPATLQLTGVTALNKVYDRTTSAPLAGQAGITAFEGDQVTLQGSLSGSFDSKNVGNAKPVSLSGLSLAGADAGNYVLALPVGLNADITPAPLVLTGLTAANKVYDAGKAAVLNGTAQIASQGQDQLILSGKAVGSFADKKVGTAKPVAVSGLSLEGADAGNYSLQSALSADITRLSLSINGLSVADKVYNANTAGVLSGTASVTPLEGDSVLLANSFGYRVAFADKNVGNGKTVTVIPLQLNVGSKGPLVSDTAFALAGPDAGNYSVAPTLSLTASIRKADLAINGLLADSKIYDGTTGATLNTSGVVLAPLGTDRVSIASGASGVFADKNAGTGKFVNVTTFALAGPDAANYNPAVPLTLFADITPRAAQLVGVTAASKVYDGLTQASVAGGGVTGLLAGDQVSLNLGTASFAGKNVGTKKAVALQGFDLGGADAGNYTLSFAGGLSADITPAALSVSGLTAQSKVYDASTTATLTGAAQLKPIDGDAVTLSAGTASFVDKNVGTAKSVVLSGFALGGADAGNYLLQPIAALSADITPAPLAIRGVTANSKVYDARSSATLAGSATVQALGKDSVSVVGSAAASFSDKNVGTGKSVNVTGYTLGGADAANYTVIQPTGLSASIRPATLVLDGVGVADKVYDTSTAATLTGAAGISALGGDIVSVDAGSASARFADKNVGTNKRVIVGNFSLSGADADNYTLQMPGNLTASITPASLSVTGISANSKVYDAGTAATLRGSATVQALGSDSVSLGGTAVARFADKNVGTAKNVSVSGLSLSGADAGNYTLSPPAELRADITPASLNIVGISANNKVYDATLVASLSGSAIVQALAGDSVGVAGNASASFGDKNVGTGKSVSVSGYTLSGADAGNYRAVAPSLTASITPASLQYVAAPVSKAIGDALPPLSGSVSGFVGGETQQTATSGVLSFRSEVDLQTAAGSYAVLGAGLSAQNYSFAQAPGNAAAFTVTGVSPTATLNQGSTVAANTVLTAPLITPSSAAAGLLDLLQAPAAGAPVAAAAAPAAAAAALGSAGNAPATPSFAGIRLGDMSPDALAGMLASRDRFKKALFADATARLEQNAALADLRTCKTQADVAAGDCLLTDELKRELQAAKAAEELAQMQAPARQPDAGKTAAALPEPKGLSINLGSKRRVKTAALPQIERKVAVVIGIDNYQDKSIPQLGNAVKDAQSIATLFDGTLGYETVVIPNASKQAVVSALTKLALELGPKDSVVIYYAGHGELVETTGLGYWQLADADAKKPETWLSNADIGRMIAQIGASQVALISDSCYSGSLVSDERVRATPGGSDPQAMLARKSVVVMSSGGNEPVFDEGKNGHSPFAWNLMNQLRQVSSWQAGGNVFERVRFAVAKELPQRPKYGSSSAAGHQAGGDYLFEQRQLEAVTQ